jgi:enoyl-[acyl-carrier-protein] reductase (NADH)
MVSLIFKDIKMDLYLKQNKQRVVSIEEKIDYIKENKSRLILPIDDMSNENLDSLLYDIKNNWNTVGHKYHEMVENWYNVLIN